MIFEHKTTLACCLKEEINGGTSELHSLSRVADKALHNQATQVTLGDIPYSITFQV